MSKHTKGVWVAVVGDDERLRSGNQRRYFPHVLMPGTFQGRLVINEGGGPMEEHDANARLIAAAPELLEALIKVKNAFELGTDIVLDERMYRSIYSGNYYEIRGLLDTAIAKARGEV